MKTASKLRVKRAQAAIDALDDYNKTVKSFNSPMARMLRRLSIAHKKANLALKKVNVAYGSEMELDSDDIRTIVPVSDYISARDASSIEILRMIMSLRDMKDSDFSKR